ncbi:MAG TPA: DUF2231 domain-containing protein [Chryseosolibacter sp.]
MRSKAQLKGHPIHPMLIPFPIAFLTGAVLADIIAITGQKADYTFTATLLLAAGIVTGLAAAIPGLIDFLYTVPPASSGKKRAATHAVLNVCMLALFTAALIYRGSGHPSPSILIITEVLGFALMLTAGWMGGTLVHRNQIGVDPRYAFAGKWKEEHLGEKGGKVELGNVDDLKRDQMKLLHVSGKRIVLARLENGLAAFEDHCTHRGGSLAGGAMICGTVQCPWHGSQFDARTGEVKAGPAKRKIRTYRIETTGGRVTIILNP